MRIGMTKMFCRIAFVAGFTFLLAGCGLIEKYGELKTEIFQENIQPEQAKRPVKKQKKKKETESTENSENTEKKEEATAKEPEVKKDFSGEYTAHVEKYAYHTLSDEEKTVYGEMLEAIMAHEETVEVSTVDTEVLENSYRAITADFGGLYWVSGYVYTQYTRNGEPTGMDFSPKYTMDQKTREQFQTQIDASVGELMAGISVVASDYEKAKYVFEILVQNVDYDSAAENNQNIISVFLNRATVCQGYACATQYLLDLLGIQSAIVTGNANGESHAWNLVRLDGEYYYMDTTWGNSRYLDNSSQIEKYVNYNYLAITSEELSRTHILDNSFPLPECTSTANNYFVRENRYFSEWEPDAVGTALAKVWNANAKDVAVKFSTPDLYRQAVDYFVTQQHIADYCENISSIYYLEDRELYVVTFHFL